MGESYRQVGLVGQVRLVGKDSEGSGWIELTHPPYLPYLPYLPVRTEP
jgi:hypothetical protein